MGKSKNLFSNNQSGFALLLVTFILALISILAIDFADEINNYQNSSRQYIEKVQAELILKSSQALAQSILELPKDPSATNQDWLNEPWNTIGAANSIPLDGFNGELRVMIVDDLGKIDLNSISARSSLTPNPNPNTPGVNDPDIFWKNVLKDLFTDLGFKKEQHDSKLYRTYGNQSYDPAEQVAIITDWIDSDSNSYNSSIFGAEGIESSGNKLWFYNREFKSIAELANVPGMTLEKIQSLAPYVKVSTGSNNINNKINVNTANYPVLKALGFTDSDIENILKQRSTAPITSTDLSQLTTGFLTNIAGKLDVKSDQFSLYSRVKMPRQTYWLKSTIKITQYNTPRRSKVISSEYY